MNWSEIGDDLKDVAPLIATALSGPYAPIIGPLVSGLIGVTGTPDAVKTTLRNNPAAVAAISTFESANGSLLKDFGDFIEHVEDTSANMDRQIAKNSATLRVLGLPILNVTW